MSFFRVFTTELARWPDVLEGKRIENGFRDRTGEFTFFTLKREEMETITNPANGLSTEYMDRRLCLTGRRRSSESTSKLCGERG